jgi:hypothetical protein
MPESWQMNAATRELITFLIAVIGAVLGVINSYVSWQRHRLRLKVIPKTSFAVFADGSPHPDCYFTTRKGETLAKYLCIEVVNKGIATTVKEVGFLLRGSHNRFPITQQIPLRRIQIPFRLEPHSSVTVCMDALTPETLPDVAKFKCAYAKVASGKRFTGRSEMMFAKYSDVDLDLGNQNAHFSPSA